MLTIFQSPSKEMLLMQTSWAADLNPLISNQLTNGNLLTNQALASGANVINHKLGRPLKGWIITRCRAAATFYDTQDASLTPQLTLNLNSSAAVTVDLWVF